MTSIYMGNLAHSATGDELREAFSQQGEVSSVTIVTDGETGRPRGFAFVEMPDGDEAATAIKTGENTETWKPNRPAKTLTLTLSQRERGPSADVSG